MTLTPTLETGVSTDETARSRRHTAYLVFDTVPHPLGKMQPPVSDLSEVPLKASSPPGTDDYRPSVAAAAAELLHSLASDGATTQKAVAAAPGVIEALVYLADQGGSDRRQSAQQRHQGAARDAARVEMQMEMEMGPPGVEDESDALDRDEDYGRAALAGSVALLSLSAGSPSTEVRSMLSLNSCVCLNPSLRTTVAVWQVRIRDAGGAPRVFSVKGAIPVRGASSLRSGSPSKAGRRRSSADDANLHPATR